MGVSISGNAELYTTKNTNITWTGVTGQTAYELMWKLKSSGAWNTCGRVNSAVSTVSLLPIYNAVEANGYSFKEIHYRVKVYTTNYVNGETHVGQYYSEAHNLIFKPGHNETMNIKDGETVIAIPLFNEADINNTNIANKLKAKTNNGIKAAPLVSNTHALSSPVHAINNQLSVAKNTPHFTATGINQSNYTGIYGSYSYNYTDSALGYRAYQYAYTGYSAPIYATYYGYRAYGQQYTYEAYGYYHYSETGSWTGSVTGLAYGRTAKYSGYGASWWEYYQSGYYSYNYHYTQREGGGYYTYSRIGYYNYNVYQYYSYTNPIPKYDGLGYSAFYYYIGRVGTAYYNYATYN